MIQHQNLTQEQLEAELRRTAEKFQQLLNEHRSKTVRNARISDPLKQGSDLWSLTRNWGLETGR